MAQVLTGASHRQELVNVIREVRHRWRMKLLVRGAIIIVVGALLAIALASYGLQATKFSPTWVTGLRVATWTVFVGLLAFWLLRPLRKRVSDQQVALYIEEYEPSLQAAILSAIHVGALGTSSTTEDVPQVIVDRMIEQAAEKARTIQGGKTVGRSHLKRYGIALATVAGLAILLMTFGPEFLRQGASALLDVRRTAEAASPYAITVAPGDSTVPRGSDQTITREARRLPIERSLADGEARRRAEVRSRAARGHRRRDDVRGHALRRQQADRVLRRSRRRPLARTTR